MKNILEQLFKKIKYFLIPLFVFLLITNFLWLSTCSNGKTNSDHTQPAKYSQKECEQFINDRTFY